MDRISTSELLSKARYDAGVSQEFMAEEMHRAKRTIINWEKGISSPSLDEILLWFDTLGINPIPSLMAYVHPEIFGSISKKYNDVQIDEALMYVVGNLSPKEKRALLYILAGNHGSSPYSVLQLMIAHLHTSLRSRVVVARLVYDNFIMDELDGKLVCPEKIMPDMEDLKNAVISAYDAVKKRHNGYVYK